MTMLRSIFISPLHTAIDSSRIYYTLYTRVFVLPSEVLAAGNFVHALDFRLRRRVDYVNTVSFVHAMSRLNVERSVFSVSSQFKHFSSKDFVLRRRGVKSVSVKNVLYK